MFLKRKLKKAVRYYKYHQRNLYKILDFFEMNEIEYAFVGGFVKDVIAYDLNKKDINVNEVNDFDIIVDTDYDNIKRMLKHYHIPFKANDFGSFKIKEHPDSTFNKEIDLWCFKDHRPFTTNLFRKEWKQIPYTAWLSICGAAYLPKSNKVYFGDLKKTLKTETIKLYRPLLFFSNEIENKFILAGKLFYLWYSGQYKMNNDCMAFLSTYLQKQDRVKGNWIPNEKHICKVAEYISRHYNDSATDWESAITKSLDKKYQYQFLEMRNTLEKNF